MSEFIHQIVDIISENFQQPETQASITTGAGLLYYFTLSNIIGFLTICLLVGQLGLVYLKYKDRHKAKKNGTKK